MMYGMPGGASAYAKVGLETGVAAASRHGLIQMLFDGAIVSIGQARAAMTAQDYARKGQAVSRALDIIDSGLRSSLDRSTGELAERLDELYEYIAMRLLEASAANATAPLDEAECLLGELRGAWATIATDAESAAPRVAVNV
jgi:flagellar secretion chaperone FliS